MMNIFDSNYKEKKLLIWINEKSSDSTFEIVMNSSTNSLKRLKNIITSYLNISNKYSERIIIFNYKGLEIDDSDIPHLVNNQVLYVSLDGKNILLTQVHLLMYIIMCMSINL